MPARPIASATISFGMVSVPVGLYSASESGATISFHWLHRKDGARLKQQYVCSAEGDKAERVEKDEMIKGYEIPGEKRYVQFTVEEIKAMEDKSGTKAIEIKEFVPISAVDRVYLEKAYYIAPEKAGERAYRLLTEALKATGRAAVGQYSARGKQYLILIRPMDNGLVMEQLHYAEEVRSIREVPVGTGEVSEAELKLAIQMIDQKASDTFKPEAYEDQVRTRMLEAIQKKMEDGREITAEPEQAPQTQIIDLMEALKASLAKSDKAAEGAKPAKKEPAKRKKAG